MFVVSQALGHRMYLSRIIRLNASALFTGGANNKRTAGDPPRRERTEQGVTRYDSIAANRVGWLAGV